MHHRQVARTAALTVLAVLASLLTLVSPAQAAESIPTLKWSPAPTIGSSVYLINTDPTGAVTLGCTTNNGGSNLVSYNNTGSLVLNINRTDVIDGAPNCIGTPVVDKTGTVYGVPSGSLSGSYALGPNLLAYGASGLKWKYPAHCDSNGPPKVAIGADGNVYVATYGHIIGLKPVLDPGQTQPTKILDITIPNDCSAFLRTYKDGLILHGQSYGNARYYSYAGKFLGQATIGDVWYEKNNADGKLFVAGYVSGSYKSGKVSMYDPATGQIAWTTIASTSGANVANIQVYPISGGGVVAKITEQKMISGIPASPTQYITTLAVLNASGIVTKSMQLPSTYSQSGMTGTYYSDNTYPVAVGQGKLAILRDMAINTGTSPSTVSGFFIGVYDIVGDTWIYQKVMTGDLAKAGGPSGYYLNSTDQFGVTNNILYLAAQCSGNCSGNTGNKLFALDIGGLSLDYPRGDVLARSPRPSTLYLAAGDSFSAGISVTPHEANTTVTNVNECYRSEYAYARLISGTSAKIPSLGSGGFRACSGAVTTNVTDLAQWNEGTQLDLWPDSTTQLVTLTIGGNDIDFVSFARACVLSSCDVGTTAYNNSLNKINNEVLDKLKATYRRVLQYAPNAKIYVAGYPQVVANKSVNDLADSRCFYMQGGSSNWAEARAARTIVTELNKKIDAAVTAVQAENASNSRLHYVDVNASDSPFVGHEVCGTAPSSWFQNIDQATGDPAYVFHPNASGQEGYATIIGAVINAG